MIKLYLFCLGILICISSNSQVSGTRSIGTTGNYITLTAAFAAINAQGITGPVILQLQSDYNPAIETYPLSPGPLTGSTAANNVLIRPATGVTNILFSSSASPVWNLAGTKYMTIDGRAGGSGSSQVTIRSTLVSGISIRFRDDAAHNKIDYLAVESNNSNTNGIIQFSTSTGSTGNSFDTISNCNIRNRSDITGVPEVLIYSAGTPAAPNASNTINGNNLFNANQRGVYLTSAGLGGNWTISNNSFYNNTASTVSTYYAIQIFGGTGFTIAGNYIGGQAPLAGGGAYTNSGFTTGPFHVLGMALSFGTGALNTVRNNVVRNISLTSLSGAIAGGIGVFSGSCDITGNRVEDITVSGTGSLTGIQSNAAGTVHNNLISGLVKTNSGGLFGVVASNSMAITIDSNTISNNTISSTGDMYGILSESTNATINSNIIKDMLQTAAVPGFFYGIAASGNNVINITRNRIYNVGATSASTGTNAVTGIYFGGTPGSTQPCIIANNQITVGNGITNNNLYQGISDAGPAGNNLSLFYNTVLVDGTSNGSQNSFAFVKNDASNETHRNNIYYNNRTSGSGIHYALAFINTAGAISSDYNLLVASLPAIVLWSATTYDFAAYKANTLQDADSYSDQPANVSSVDLFTGPAAGNLDIKTGNVESWYVNGKGIAGAPSGNINTDYDGNTRGTTLGMPTDIGAHEFTTGTIPPDAIPSGPPSPGGITTFTFAGRVLGTVTWGTGGSVPSSIAWKYFSGVTPITQGITINSYWNLTAPDGAGYAYDIKLYYTLAEQNNLNDNTLLVFKKDTGQWYIPATSAQSFDAPGNYVRTSAQLLTSLLNFTLGSSLVLPSHIIAFAGIRKGTANILNWTIAQEQDVHGYYIQRSPDGRNFAPIGFVRSLGNSGMAQNYEFMDDNAGPGRQYYRLQQTGLDGRSRISNVVIIKEEMGASLAIVSAFPNPVSATINLMIESPTRNNLTMVVNDMSGKVVMMQKMVVERGANPVHLNVEILAPGAYTLKITSPDKQESAILRFIRQ